MGGQMLKSLNVTRISRSDLTTRMARFVQIWEDLAWGDNTCPVWYFEFPVQLRDKEDAGDLDIIFSCLPENKAAVLEHVQVAFNTRGSKVNGNCMSIEWENLQVDMIYVPDLDTLEWASNWYSHGDFMAITGRVFRFYHFILKNNGLYFSVKTENLKDEVFVTLDWKAALDLLEYPYITRHGIYRESDIYEFVFSSPYAFPGIFNSIHPERPTKRPMQQRFYEWLETQDMTEHKKRSLGWSLLYNINKSAYYEARTKQMKLVAKELVTPLKRLYKKVWNKTLKPKVYAALGKDLSKGKRNVRN